jgi:lipopolysaccharide transport system ATP-binding protein
MSEIAIKLENVSKQYRLGVVNTLTLKADVQRWIARITGKEDPFLKIGQENILNKALNPQNFKLNNDYVWALRDINLEVEQGEVLGIIGKNGAGKSTLLKLLSRVTTPTTGEIKVAGRIASLLEVGTGFHPELTGRENIFLNGAILGMTKLEIRTKFDEIVDFSGVEKYIDTPVKRYSSGMYVRLAFAVAAHLDPEVLIVDEVLAVGDAEFQNKAIGKMKDVSKGEGRTVLFVSHNMSSISLLCNKVIGINYGQIQICDNPKNVIDWYLNLNNDLKSSNQIGKVIKEITINNCDNKYSFTIISGQSMDLIIKYNTPVEIFAPNISISIYSGNNLKIASFTTYSFGNILKSFKKSGTIICKIEKLPLLPGNYYINLSLHDNDKLIDHIINAVKLTVELDSNMKIIRLPNDPGLLLINNNWEQIQDEI